MLTGDHNAVADRPPTTLLLLLPLTTWAAIHSLAAAVEHAHVRAEGLYLAVWVAALVAVLLGVAPRPRAEAPIVAVLATSVVWGTHAHSTPAAATGLMLTVALAVACWRRLAVGNWQLDLQALCALAIGMQALLRPELFLAGQPMWQRMLELLVFPLAGASFAFALQRVAAERALIVALLAVASAGGWGPATVLWLAAAAAASQLFTPDGKARLLPLLAWLAVVAALGWNDLDHAVLLFAATAAIQRRTLAWRIPRSRALVLGALGVLVVAVGWLLFAGQRSGWPGGVYQPALLGLLLPTLGWSALHRPREVLPLLGVAVAGLVALPPGEALVPVLPFLAVALPSERHLSAAQGAWSAMVVAAACLLAGYPWLRGDPVGETLALLGARELVALTPLAIAASLALGFAARKSPARLDWLRTVPGVVLVLPLVAVAVQLPPGGRSLITENVVLRSTAPTWRAESSSTGLVRTVVIDSYLTHSARFQPGEQVARVVLEVDGREHDAWTLRAGIDTGEWAARRPDIAARENFEAPPPWIAWSEAERRFFAQRYRTVLHAESALPAAAVTIHWIAAAEDLELVLTHVETRP